MTKCSHPGGLQRLRQGVLPDQQAVSTCQACLLPLATRQICALSPVADVSPDKVQLQCGYYHPKCLKCSKCGSNLADLHFRCFQLREKELVCLQCKFRLTHCFRCNLPMREDTWVFKLNNLPFHLSCFTCSKCDRQLCQGETCILNGNLLLCSEHCTSRSTLVKVFTDETTASTDHPDSFVSELKCDDLEVSAADATLHSMKLSLGSSSANSFMHSSSEKEEFKRLMAMDECPSYMVRSPGLEELTEAHGPLQASLTEDDALPDEVDDFSSNGSSRRTGSNNGASASLAEFASQSRRRSTSSQNGLYATSSSCASKSKRIRTSFTPDQLAILQANFELEANPDGQELERIANSANLNKRVTQVWFQNARARKKKTERYADGSVLNGNSVDISGLRMDEIGRFMKNTHCESQEMSLIGVSAALLDGESLQQLRGSSPSVWLGSAQSPKVG